MWNLKYDRHELVYKTETDSDMENRPTVAGGRGGEGRVGSLGLEGAECYMSDA